MIMSGARQERAIETRRSIFTVRLRGGRETELKLIRFPSAVEDEEIKTRMEKEGLRPIKPVEYRAFISQVLKNRGAGFPIAAFGNAIRGDLENGGFSETPYLDTEANLTSVANWTMPRWEVDWRFLFARQKPSKKVVTPNAKIGN